MNWSPPNKVIIQGITASHAAFYAVQMKAYGAEIVAGVSPGSGGSKIEDIPVFDLVEQVPDSEVDLSLIFVHPFQVLDAAMEAIAAGIKRIIIFTPQVPPLDTIKLIKYARANQALVLGPGSQGIMIPQQVWLGTLQPQFYHPGDVGLITTSEYLSYEVAAELNLAGIGQSMIVSLGKDRIVGSGLPQWLSILNQDPLTKAIVFIDQSIKQVEEIISQCQEHKYNKPIIVYIAGLKAPQEKVFYDAVTILSNHLSASIPAANRDRQKISKLKKVGLKIAKKPSEIPPMVLGALARS